MIKTVGRLLIAAATLLSLIFLGAPAATASPVITGWSCDSGASKFYCTVYTTAPVSAHWDFYQPGYGYQFSLDNNGQTGLHYCQAPRYYTFNVYVTDSTGTAQTSGYFYCNRYAWP